MSVYMEFALSKSNLNLLAAHRVQQTKIICFSFRRYRNESLVDNLLNVTDVKIAQFYILLCFLKVFLNQKILVGHEKVLIKD